MGLYYFSHVTFTASEKGKGGDQSLTFISYSAQHYSTPRYHASFSDGGEFNTLPLAIGRALQMVSGGADMIDIGGESTRPGSVAVTVQEEIERVVPVIR